jgi:acyl-CoA synthetase (NDP forming)
MKRLVVTGGGRPHAGSAGEALQKRLERLRLDDAAQVIGPNGGTVVDTVCGVSMDPGPGAVAHRLRRGSIGLLSQSASIIETFVGGGWVGLSTAISTGTEAVLRVPDYLRFLAEDEMTSAVLAYIESFKDPGALLSAAASLSRRGKRLAICTVGRSAVSVQGAGTHSGTLGASYRLAAAALRQVGAVVCHDLEELVALGVLFEASSLRPHDRRLHAIVYSGGEGNLLADAAQDAGLVLPAMTARASRAIHRRWPEAVVRNPFDVWALDHYAVALPEIIRISADEPGGVLLVLMKQGAWTSEEEVGISRDIVEALATHAVRRHKLPVLLSPLASEPDGAIAALCRRKGVVLLGGLRTGLPALANLIAEASKGNGPAPHEHAEPAKTVEGGALSSERVRVLDEHRSLSLFDQHGVPTARRVVVSTAQGALQAAGGMTKPLVVKALSEDLPHKSRLGLVDTGLCSAHSVHASATRILKRARDLGHPVQLLVAEQVAGGLEAMCGFKRDPVFGPSLILGLGGVSTELLDSVVVHVGPVEEATARSMVEKSSIGAALRSVWGGADAAKSFVDVVCRISQLGSDNDLVLEVDANPIVLTASGAVAVDGLVILARQQMRGVPTGSD